MWDSIRGVVAATLWTASGALMVVGTLEEKGAAALAFMGWGLFVGLHACMVTAWIVATWVARIERVRVDRVVEVVVARLTEESGLPRI
jgi:hypothetical protein